MINASELRKGIIIEMDDKLYQVVDYQHVKMKRTALARVKLRSITGGNTIEHTFQSDARLPRVELELSRMQYLYNDGEMYYFMDEQNYEQTLITAERLGDALNYLKDGLTVEVSSYQGKVIGIEMPITVELEVTETEPGFKGDTATGANKPATLETGFIIQVPLFINRGDIIKVDTRSGAYLERSG